MNVWSLALIGNASAHRIGAKTCRPSRGIFDKETRRKPLAFAADAAAMAIGRWFGTRWRCKIVGGVEVGSVCGAVSAGKVASKALEIVSLRVFRGFWTDADGGVQTARPSSGSQADHQEESKKVRRRDSSAVVNFWTTIMGTPHAGHFQKEDSWAGVASAAGALAAQPRTSRQIARRAFRQRLARNPK